MQLYERGIRRRLAPMLQGDRRRLELAYSLMMTLPGTPVIRYGDEIGMGDDLRLPERNCARTPMQWSTEPQGGFTKSDNPFCRYRRRALWLSTCQCGAAAARSELHAELDRTHHPHAQGGAGNRLGHIHSAGAGNAGGVGTALRLAEQRLRGGAQSRCLPARDNAQGRKRTLTDDVSW